MLRTFEDRPQRRQEDQKRKKETVLNPTFHREKHTSVSSHRRHADDDLPRLFVGARAGPGQQSGAQRAPAQAGPGLWPQLGRLQGPVGPEADQGQPERPGGQRGGASARLLQVLGLVVALNVPVEVDGAPAQEDTVDRSALVDYQAWNKRRR